MVINDEQYDDYIDEKKISRRGFIRGAAVTAITAGAVATGHSALQTGSDLPTITSAPISQSVQTAVSPTTFTANSSDLISQIANLTAENFRLKTELSTSQGQISNLQQSTTDQTVSTEAMTLELDKATQQIGVLAGLVALYEQIDDVALDKVVDKGFTAVSNTITNLLDELPALEEGVQLGQIALNDFEAQLPLLQNGRQWLSRHIEQLAARFSAVELVLQETAERVGPLLTMLEAWFANVNKWLPFNIGQKASQIMATITDLILETPSTLAGMSTNIAEPLDLLLSENGEAHPVQQNLIHPIREKLIAKTTTAVSKTQQLTSTYATELEQPLRTAVDQQQIIRQLITHYRQEHNV